MQLCRVKSFGTFGMPCRRGRPARRTAAAGSARCAWRSPARPAASPKRMQTSNESSVSGGGFDRQLQLHFDVAGDLRTKREISGATWLRPKPSVAFTRSRPFGVPLDTPSSWSRSSISPRMRRACSRYSSPSGVRLMRRVVRLTSGTPRRASICARRLLTAGVVMPSSRAAALRLPRRPARRRSRDRPAGCRSS